MVRVSQWRWPTLIPRKATPRVRVARVAAVREPAEQASLASPESTECALCESDPARRDFQDTLPLVFHVGGHAGPEAPEA
jgi:hypothetical protein